MEAQGTQQAPLSVTQATALAKRHVAALGSFTVTGEVAGFRGPHRTGHCYFQVRDDSSSMDVIVWKNIFQSSGVPLKDGLLVQMTGAFDVYDKTGKLSFVARHIEAAGEGLLRQQVAALANKLAQEGLMDDARKRPIPRFCSRVCMVTSLSGSVRDDVCRTLARRNPLVQIDIVGCAVQGPAAAPTIVRALGIAAASAPDAILLVRGGGSFEDLMCFNDEALARAIAACPVPVITGIGHEPDTSIADMVADRRCSTPTAAAESVAPAIDELVAGLDSAGARLYQSLSSRLAGELQFTQNLGIRAAQAVTRAVSLKRGAVEALAARPCLTNPAYMLERRKTDLAYAEQRLFDAVPRAMEKRRGALDSLASRLAVLGGGLLAPYEHALARSAATLEALSPLKVLGRGYAIARDGAGHVVSSAAQVKAGDELEVLLGAGSVRTRVESTQVSPENPS